MRAAPRSALAAIQAHPYPYPDKCLIHLLRGRVLCAYQALEGGVMGSPQTGGSHPTPAIVRAGDGSHGVGGAKHSNRDCVGAWLRWVLEGQPLPPPRRQQPPPVAHNQGHFGGGDAVVCTAKGACAELVQKE